MVNFTVRLSEDTVKMLKARSIQTNEPVSCIARRLIGQGVSQETAGENAPAITVECVARKESDRLARLIIKTMKAAAAGMYLAAQTAGDTEAESRELLDDALEMAAKYVKLPYSLRDAGEGGPVSITDEEFFELCFGAGEQS